MEYFMIISNIYSTYYSKPLLWKFSTTDISLLSYSQSIMAILSSEEILCNWLLFLFYFTEFKTYTLIHTSHSLKGDSQDKAFKVHGDITLPCPSVSCLCIGEYTEEGLPRLLTPSISSPFTNHREYSSGRIHVASTTGLECHTVV